MEKQIKEAGHSAPWMVTVVQAQLDEMAGACNQLHQANREIKFIVPIAHVEGTGLDRPTSHIAIFTLPAAQPAVLPPQGF